MIVLDGKSLANELYAQYGEILRKNRGRPPALAALLVGDDSASHLYVNNKTRACEKAGIDSHKRLFPSQITQDELIKEIQQLNDSPTIDGILLQLPLPHHIDPVAVTMAISPDKDVDGFHPLNMGKLLRGDEGGFVPCTPLGIQLLLHSYKIPISGKHLVILGRSTIVGKPLAALLMQKKTGANATVTILHSRSEEIERCCREADILVAAMGKARFVTAAMVKEGAVVVDVGINRLAAGEGLTGDVDFEAVKGRCSAITPVPGGVGPMTIAMLLYNTLKSYSRRTAQCIDLSSLGPLLS